MNFLLNKIRNQVNKSNLFLALLLFVGLSTSMPTYGQNYELASTVSVPNGAKVVGYTGKILVTDKIIDNATYVVTNMPGFEDTGTKGWLTLPNSDTIYYGVSSGNLFYKVGISGTWAWIFSSNGHNVTMATAILTGSTVEDIKWYFRSPSGLHECLGTYGSSTQVINSGAINSVTTNGIV